jgi:hypothetical protein
MLDGLGSGHVHVAGCEVCDGHDRPSSRTLRSWYLVYFHVNHRIFLKNGSRDEPLVTAEVRWAVNDVKE